MIAGTVPYQHAGTPAWLIPARLPLWYMEAIVSMYTILASIGCGPHVSSSCGEEDTCASSYAVGVQRAGDQIFLAQESETQDSRTGVSLCVRQ